MKKVLAVFLVFVVTLIAYAAADRSIQLYKLIMRESGGANVINIVPPSLSADYTLTMPVDDGTSNQVLTTNGSGTLSWSTPSSSTIDTSIILNWTGTQSIGAAAETLLTLSSASFTKLEDFTHSGGTFTATATGNYLITCTYVSNWVTGTPTIRHHRVSIYKNGAYFISGGWVGGAAYNALEDKDLVATVTAIVPLSTSDTFGCYAYQSNSSGTAYDAVQVQVNAIYFP